MVVSFGLHRFKPGNGRQGGKWRTPHRFRIVHVSSGSELDLGRDLAHGANDFSVL